MRKFAIRAYMSFVFIAIASSIVTVSGVIKFAFFDHKISGTDLIYVMHMLALSFASIFTCIVIRREIR